MSDNILKWFLPYMLIASFNYQVAKDGLTYASPLTFMLLRYLLAAGILIGISRKVIITKQSLVLGMVTGLSSFFWILGLGIVSPGDSAVLTYTMPLFAIPLALIILKEKPFKIEIAGSLVGFLGVAVYSLGFLGGSLLLGLVYTLLNAFFWAAYSVYLRKMRGEDAKSLIGTQFLLGSIPLMLGSFFDARVSLTQGFVFDLLYVSLLGGVIQFFLWNRLLRLVRVGRLTTMAFAIPATAVAFQSVESYTLPTPGAILGASLMFLGIYMSNSDRLGTRLRAPHENRASELPSRSPASQQRIRSSVRPLHSFTKRSWPFSR